MPRELSYWLALTCLWWKWSTMVASKSQSYSNSRTLILQTAGLLPLTHECQRSTVSLLQLWLETVVSRDDKLQEGTAFTACTVVSLGLAQFLHKKKNQYLQCPESQHFSRGELHVCGRSLCNIPVSPVLPSAIWWVFLLTWAHLRSADARERCRCLGK